MVPKYYSNLCLSQFSNYNLIQTQILTLTLSPNLILHVNAICISYIQSTENSFVYSFLEMERNNNIILRSFIHNDFWFKSINFITGRYVTSEIFINSSSANGALWYFTTLSVDENFKCQGTQNLTRTCHEKCNLGAPGWESNH